MPRNGTSQCLVCQKTFWRYPSQKTVHCSRACQSVSYSNAYNKHVEKRFWLLAATNANGCLDWKGAKNRTNHGFFRYKKKNFYAHRFLWINLLGREIPEGFHLHHKCANPACVNADHLEVLSPKEHKARHPYARPVVLKLWCSNGHALTPENTILKGRQIGCRTCTRESARRGYRRKHPIQHLLIKKTPEEVKIYAKAYAKAWREKNRQKINEQSRLRRLENIEARRKYEREWARAKFLKDPDKMRAYQRALYRKKVEASDG